jgi:hypothetical protein
MTRRIIAILLTAELMGCVAAPPMSPETWDDAACRQHGWMPGTIQYGNCMNYIGPARDLAAQWRRVLDE